MLSFVWAGMILAAFAYSAFTGRLDTLGGAVVSSAENAVAMLIFLAAVIPFWSGVMNVASAAGITKGAAKLLRPVLKRLFPRSFENDVCAEAISMNVAANIIGVGSAATPFGLKAIGEMSGRRGGEPDAEMIRFVVLNTASVQLIPTTVAAMRARAGAESPFDIVPAVLICTIAALATGLLSSELFRRLYERKRVLRGRRVWRT
ncbi:MAG: spore maturation protein A [Clostridia bacterium]|nr:spore maturation protein A [Clostridia bacterium]MBR5769833.1 spore maturation protein A [Clostridia bacterium]